MRVFLLWAALSTSCFAQTFGTWSLNPGRSTFAGDTPPKSLTIRIEAHPKGEVFTFDRVEANGRTTSVSSILYLDGKSRDFQDFACSGTQSSWRVNSRTVEILRTCGTGGWIKYVRWASAKTNELTIEVIEQYADGRRFDRRLTLERQ
jgi:hypothetical protein